MSVRTAEKRGVFRRMGSRHADDSGIYGAKAQKLGAWHAMLLVMVFDGERDIHQKLVKP